MYLPGICFACQKCLFCFSLSQLNPCNCNKNTKPKRVSETKRGQQIYLRVYTPNENLPTANYFLSTADTKFQYNHNFNEPFSYTFCTACNSKFQRLKSKDKLAKKKMKSKNKAIIDVESRELSEGEEYDIDEIKLHVSIEKKGKKTSTSKTLTIQPVEYTNVMEKINIFVQKTLQNGNIKLTDYSMSYKAMNARGLASELEDKLDFKEFIDDYKKITAANKKMGVMIVIENSSDEETKSMSEKRSKVIKNLQLLLLFYISNIINFKFADF
jgi:hypothetical protein